MNEEKTKSERLLEGAREIARRLKESGHQAWLVGGCVRDRLLGRELKDVDLVTDAKPDAIATMFENVKMVGAKFAVVLVRLKDFHFEVATFRKEGLYLDHRHPSEVSFGTMEEDVQRRDFTINALYQDPETGEVVDMVGGREDLENRLIRCVGDPRKRFEEDALRLLRAIRFACQVEFEIEAKTWDALKDLAPTIQYISPERQRDELTRMFCGPQPGRALRLLDGAGLLTWLLPEVEVMKGVEQPEIYHPEGDVFVHTCLVLDYLPEKNPVTAWGALLHDVGKPVTQDRDPETGRIRFHQHQSIGAEMAEVILRRFRFSNEEIRAICDIVRRHMTFMHIFEMRKSTLRRFLAADTIEDELAVHYADCKGSHAKLDGFYYAKEKLEEFREEEENVLPEPPIDGKDLIALGFEPGPIFGEILNEVADRHMEGELPDRESALEWVKENYQG